MNTFGIDRFLNIRSAMMPTISADGRRIAHLTDVTGVFEVWDASVDGTLPQQLTATGETARGAWYSPTDHQLIFSADRGGNERTQLFRLYPIDRSSEQWGEGWIWDALTNSPDAIHSFGGWSRDGRHVAFAANRTDPARFDVFAQPLLGEARMLREGPGGYFMPAGWSPDGATLLAAAVHSSTNQNLYLLDVASGEASDLTPHKGEVSYTPAAWSADGRLIYCVSTFDRDLEALAQIDVSGGRLTYVEMPPSPVEGIAVSDGGRWLAWSVNAGGLSELYIRDLRSSETAQLTELPLGVVSDLTFSRDERMLAFTFQGPAYNPDLWIWDLREDRLRRVTTSSRAGIPASIFVEPELIQYQTFDGRMIPAWFYPARHARGADRPVILYAHGGPESQSRPAWNAVLQFFLHYGYSILAPNVRGSYGYGTTYMNLDNIERRMDSVADLAHAAYWLRESGRVDPRRIAVYGASYGGFMVLAAVSTYPELFAAGVDIVGIANFITFLEHTGAYRRAHREAEYGNLREHRPLLEQISPITHVDKIRCPMMIIHGANDPRVPLGEAEQIVSALRSRNIPVEYLRYDDEGHGLVRLKNRLDAYPRIVAFLQRFLG